MQNKKLIAVASVMVLAACADGPKLAEEASPPRPDVLVPTQEECDEVVVRPYDPITRGASKIEDKVDRQIESDARTRNYVGQLELALVKCGGEVVDPE